MKRLTINSILSLAAILIFNISCNETEDPLPQLLAGFSSTSLGLTLEDENGTVSIELSRVDAAATIITLNLLEQAGAVYGEDYSTEPAATDGVITLEIPAQSSSADLVINKLKNPDFEEVKAFSVSISEVTNGGDIGANGTLSVTFEENPTSSGAQLRPDVGGPEQPNQVYIDLSKQTTSTIDKASWDLGFNSGENFRVTLNYATYAMAKVTDQTDLAAITEVLVTEEYKADMVPGIPNNIDYMDDPTGDLTKTTIAEISDNTSDNKVYVLNRGHLDTEPATELGFVKFKIDKSGDDYVITYGDIIDLDNFSSVTIAKDSEFSFNYFSFDDGEVQVEPAMVDWDIVMTTFISEFPTGDDVYSYKFPDYVLTNYGNVEVTSVEVTDMVTYDGFTMNDLSNVTLEDNRLGIKNSWRGFNFQDFSYFLKSDIFYIIKDTDGNNYKLKFTAMFNESGDRGYPEFVYELLK